MASMSPSEPSRATREFELSSLTSCALAKPNFVARSLHWSASKALEEASHSTHSETLCTTFAACTFVRSSASATTFASADSRAGGGVSASTRERFW